MHWCRMDNAFAPQTLSGEDDDGPALGSIAIKPLLATCQKNALPECLTGEN
jgi:hypothetical protein